MESMSENWMSKGLCRVEKVPLSKFFEEYEQDINTQIYVDKLCASCPVRHRCEDYGRRINAYGGVFGRKYFTEEKKSVRKVKERTTA